jgi:hypothetical protein
MDTETMTTTNNQTAGHIAATAIAVRHAANAVCKTSTLMHDMMHELRDSKIWSLIIRKKTGS